MPINMNGKPGEHGDENAGSFLVRHHLWIFLALLLSVSAPYYLSLGNPFTDDDWMFLHYYGRRPLWSLFSPRVLWFYRPLQSLYFAIFYRLFDLNPWPFNLASLALYFGGAAAWYGLLRRLLRGSAGLALLATTIFLVNWQFCDVVFWESNFGGLVAWLGTVAVLHATLSDARSPAWRGLIFQSAAFAFALLGKETAVNIPLLAGLVYLYAWHEALADSPRRTLMAAGRRLVPLFALLAAYLVFHFACVVDIEQVDLKGYGYAAPWTVVKQYLFAMNHLLFFFGQSPMAARLNPVFAFLAGRLWLWAPALWLWALWRRDRLMLFALGLTSAALLPPVLSVNFHYARYYLVPASGMGLVWAAVGRRLVRAARGWPAPALRMARLAGVAVLVFVLLRSEVQLYSLVARDVGNTHLMGEFQDYLVQHRAEFPPDVCLIFDGLSREVSTGLGLRQMTKILLRSEQAEAIKNGAQLTTDYVRRLNTQYPHKVLIWRDEQGRIKTRDVGNAQIMGTK